MNNISALDFLAFDAVEQNETRNNDVFTSLVSLASYALVKDEQPVSNIDLVKIVSAHSNSLNRRSVKLLQKKLLKVSKMNLIT